MFDRLLCLYDLPLPEDPKGYTGAVEFQTKNFDNFLDYYKIDQDGKFWFLKKENKGSKWIPHQITDTITIRNSHIYDYNEKYDYSIVYEIVIIKGVLDSAKIIDFTVNLNEDRKKLIDELNERDNFEQTFLYKYCFSYYNRTLNYLFKLVFKLLDLMYKLAWRIENKLRI